MKSYFKPVVSWIIALWAAKVFLFSFPYKFTNHPVTEHIFGTIGQWISDTINVGLGSVFSSVGAYAVGSVELITSVILLLPAVLWVLHKLRRDKAGDSALDKKSPWSRERFHALGGLLASAVMAGAVFFHLFTPLGIEVVHEGKGDGGSLFYSAVSILVLGLVLFFINRSGLLKGRPA